MPAVSLGEDWPMWGGTPEAQHGQRREGPARYARSRASRRPRGIRRSPRPRTSSGPCRWVHLAYRCDLSGDEDAAIDYYKAITSSSPIYTSALLNLAVIYEDKADYDKAERCVQKVLACHPNHKRANLFLKDIQSSKTMVYDEETEKKKTRKMQILETPLSDFELSVRSRNCLKKMNLNTLGDLLRTTEAESACV